MCSEKNILTNGTTYTKKKKSYAKGKHLAGTREFFVPPFKRLFEEPPSSLGRKRGVGGGGGGTEAGRCSKIPFRKWSLPFGRHLKQFSLLSLSFARTLLKKWVDDIELGSVVEEQRHLTTRLSR